MVIMKYFKEREKEQLLSEYLQKGQTDFKSCLCSEEKRIARTKYLIEILGDVAFSKEIYQQFIEKFQCFGGRYDVRTKKETIKGIYEITKKYPQFSKEAIDEIWFGYIKDLYDEYDLIGVLDKQFEIYGQKDETFELFTKYVEQAADEQQKKYIAEASKVDELKDEYSKDFVLHIKSLIKRQHYTYDDIKQCLPSTELIKKDEQHLSDISTKTRIFFGCCEPVSYTMVDLLLETKTLDSFPEIPTYYISTGREEQATFTKQEFLESIGRQKQLQKKR